MADIVIRDALPGEMDEVRAAYWEYAHWMGEDLNFQGFEDELKSLTGYYARPGGCLLIARDGEHLAGTVALRPLGDGICEMKRLFVREQYRKVGLGRRLVDRVLAEARAIGYGRMRLDTLAKMVPAMTLYKSVGFQEIPITEIYNTFRGALAPVFEGLKEDETEENIQARVRGTLLMSLSNKFNAILLSTGNKSETAVGYCTMYGDMNGGLAVISDIPKTMCYKLARFINRDREIIPVRDRKSVV